MIREKKHALPVELQPEMVGLVGLEPTTLLGMYSNRQSRPGCQVISSPTKKCRDRAI